MPDISSELTFVFTDIEASTRKWEEHPDAMATAVDLHDRILVEVVTAHGGTVIKLTGDGLFARFDVAADAVAASVAAQRALIEVPPSSVEPLRVRIGLHCGVPVVAGHGDYLGPTPNRCARIMAAAHGGQVVVSEAVVASGSLPDDVELIDLGLHELRDVPEPVRLFQVQAEGLEREFPPLKTIGEHPNNLPEPVSSFVGRVKAVAQIGDLLDQRRLVTLVGPGGCGKTRLAVEAAAARVRHHADGVWLVGLADVSPSDTPSTEGVAAAVAAALGIQEEQSRLLSDTVRDRLRGTEMLLVLDNCEHVLRDAALFAQQILEAGRSVRVMATGREPLGLVGEAVYVVDPLPVPDDDALSFDAEAVQLFLDRATLARPGFEPTDDDLRRIGHVCRRLDGIPLALELAAARLRGAHRLPAGGSPRLPLPAAGRHRGPHAAPPHPPGHVGLELRPALAGGARRRLPALGLRRRLRPGGGQPGDRHARAGDARHPRPPRGPIAAHHARRRRHGALPHARDHAGVRPRHAPRGRPAHRDRGTPPRLGRRARVTGRTAPHGCGGSRMARPAGARAAQPAPRGVVGAGRRAGRRHRPGCRPRPLCLAAGTPGRRPELVRAGPRGLPRCRAPEQGPRPPGPR